MTEMRSNNEISACQRTFMGHAWGQVEHVSRLQLHGLVHAEVPQQLRRRAAHLPLLLLLLGEERVLYGPPATATAA
jgi:hypothetical protein